LTGWSTIGLDLAGERNSVNRGEIATRMGAISSSLALSLRDDLTMKGSLGGKLDHKEQPQLDSQEEGLSYGLTSSWQPILIGTQAAVKMALSGDRLTAGHSSSRSVLASVKRQLFTGAHVSLSFDDQDEERTNLFGPTEATVLKRQDRINRSLNLTVELPLPRDHQLRMSLSSLDRRIEYSLPDGPDQEVAEQNSRKATQSLAAQVSGSPLSGLVLNSDFTLEQGVNDFGRDINDEDVEEVSLSAGLGALLSPRDSLGFSGHVARTSFDTPHPDNYNDRDNFRSALKFSYIHTFSEALELAAEATANLNHLVYLRRQRSANNNWGRLYALYPSLRLRPWNSLMIQQGFSISASYTEYDFDDLFTDIKSNIFRQAKTSTVVSYRLGEELTLDFAYTYRAEDFGRLVKEDRWVEILSWDKSFQNMDVSVSYALFSKLVLTPNLGYGHRREYEHVQGGRHFKARMISKRVGLSGRYRLYPDNAVIFSVGRSVEDATDSPQWIYDRLQLNLQHTF